MIPPVLTIDVDGIVLRRWFGYEKKIRWEEVASLHYNFGSKYFTVRDSNGRKIVHTVFHAEGPMFMKKVRERTRLPMKITRPGVLKRKAIELPPLRRAEIASWRTILIRSSWHVQF